MVKSEGTRTLWMTCGRRPIARRFEQHFDEAEQFDCARPGPGKINLHAAVHAQDGLETPDFGLCKTGAETSLTCRGSVFHKDSMTMHRSKRQGEELARARSVPCILELKVTLRDITPPIWRRFQVRADLTLGRFHQVLQRVMGWTDSHLHEFTCRGDRYCITDPELDLPPPRADERRVRLHELLARPGDQLTYEYDYGDGWEHDVVLERVVPFDANASYPLVLGGERACPPEDSGGVPGYAYLLEVLAHPEHPEHRELRDWAGRGFDPEAFDLRGINRAFRGRRRAARQAGVSAGSPEEVVEEAGTARPAAVWITDARHFLNPDGRVAPRAMRLGIVRQVSAIIAAVTQEGAGPDAANTVACHRRPGRRACPGRIAAHLAPDGRIAWQCSKCGDQGWISNWRGTPWDAGRGVASRSVR